MINNTYSLQDYEMLAYEFAIRNKRVIELLGLPLTDQIVQELLTYGIDATSVYFSEEEGEVIISSIQELFLDYQHLGHLKHKPYSPYGEGRKEDAKTGKEDDNFRGNRYLKHPKFKNNFMHVESQIDALNRISQLIETRGKKLSRLMCGESFLSYDKVILEGGSVYSVDKTKRRQRTINSDIEFIAEWINPVKYLQLLPKHKSRFQF